MVHQTVTTSSVQAGQSGTRKFVYKDAYFFKFLPENSVKFSEKLSPQEWVFNPHIF